jgi:hypothetical protein
MLPTNHESGASILSGAIHHLHQRWNDGVRNASVLHRELQDLGWRGSLGTVHRSPPNCASRRPTPTTPTPPKPRMKTIKRSMYGRANLDLLRRRALII